VNGTAVLTTTGSAVTSTVPVLVADAAGASAPSLAAKDDTDTGIAFAGATLRYAMGGTYYMGMFATEFQLQSATSLGWSSGNIGSASDVSLSRGAANRLDFGAADFLRIPAVAVGDLPACAAGLLGSRHTVNDANAAFTAGIGAVVAAGGANVVPVFCDGTNWRIG
jgi:hypothetical protein